MNKRVFRRDVVVDDHDQQQRIDSNKLQTQNSMINLDTTLNKLQAHQERIQRLRATQEKQKAKTDAQKRLERLDASREDYLARRGFDRNNSSADNFTFVI